MAFDTMHKRWLEIAGKFDDQDFIAYTTSNGEQVANYFADLLQENLLHAAHHRGQIALLLRMKGFKPPVSTDYIPALRRGSFRSE